MSSHSAHCTARPLAGEVNCVVRDPTAQNAMAERTNEPPTVAQARKFTFARPMNLPRTPQRSAPTRGRAMITQSRSAIATGLQGYAGLRSSLMSGSEPHRPGVVDVHRPAAAAGG